MADYTGSIADENTNSPTAGERAMSRVISAAKTVADHAAVLRDIIDGIDPRRGNPIAMMFDAPNKAQAVENLRCASATLAIEIARATT